MSGPFDDLTEAQRQQIREAHAENKIRSATATEPWCNHDPEAINDGVCECGQRICTVCGDETSAGIEVNGEPVCEDCDQELSDGADAAALDRISSLLREADWGYVLCDEIARIVRESGRDYSAGPDDVACGQADDEAMS